MAASHADLLRGIAAILDEWPGLPLPQVNYDGRVYWFVLDAFEMEMVIGTFHSEWVAAEAGEDGYAAEYLVTGTVFMGHEMQVIVPRAAAAS